MNQKGNASAKAAQERPQILSFFLKPHSLEELRDFGRTHQYSTGPNSLMEAQQYLSHKLEALKAELRQINSAITQAAFNDDDEAIKKCISRRSVLETKIKFENWLLERVDLCKNYERIDAAIANRNAEEMMERRRNTPRIFDPKFPVASTFFDI